jgi:hypothetical protein
MDPENLAWGLAAAVSIASAALSTGHVIVAVVVYVIITALGVAAPLVVMKPIWDKAQAILASWKLWLGQSNATVTAVLILAFGVVLIGKGVVGR